MAYFWPIFELWPIFLEHFSEKFAQNSRKTLPKARMKSMKNHLIFFTVAYSPSAFSVMAYLCFPSLLCV